MRPSPTLPGDCGRYRPPIDLKCCEGAFDCPRHTQITQGARTHVSPAIDWPENRTSGDPRKSEAVNQINYVTEDRLSESGKARRLCSSHQALKCFHSAA